MSFTKIKLPKFKKPTKRQVLHGAKYCATIVLGNAIAAAASAFFIIPYGLVMGGTTGIGIFVRDLLTRYSNADPELREWAVNITVYAANIVLFVIGAVLLGKKFAGATLAGTLLYPSFMSLYTVLNNLYVSHTGMHIAGEDVMLAVLFGAVLFGVGLAIVVRVGASTGGTDIPPLILHKFFGFSISASLWAIDLVIILIQSFINTFDTILYGVLICLISSVVIDVVSPIGMKKQQVKIVSKHYRQIRDMILNKLNRGVTVLFGQTGYLKEKCFVLLTIVSNRELVRLKNEVQRIDPEAFMTISVVSEVRGRGFTSEGIKLPKEAEGKDDLEEVELPPPGGEQQS